MAIGFITPSKTCGANVYKMFEGGIIHERIHAEFTVARQRRMEKGFPGHAGSAPRPWGDLGGVPT